MSKTAAKTAEYVENVEFPSFDASKMTDQMRAFAEKGVEQTKEVYSTIRSGAESTQKAFESTLDTVKSAGGDLSLKAVAALRTNTEMGFAHIEALLGVKSVSEFIELQTAFLRKGVETAVEQAKDFQAASSRAAEEVSRPMKAVFEKAAKEMKVA